MLRIIGKTWAINGQIIGSMYKKVLFSTVVFVLTFSLAAGAQAGIVRNDSNLSVVINSGFADANANNLTGVRGQTDVKIASFVLSAPYKNIIVNKIVLKNGSDAALALGNDFQNLRLMNNGAQIAPTIGTLSQMANATYMIYPTDGINIPADGYYVIDVYVDSLTSAINIDRAYSAVLLDSVWGVNTSNRAKISWGAKSSKSGEKDVAGQNVYVADKGSLSVWMTSAPPSQNIVMGAANQILASFRFSASTENIMITKIVVTDTISGAITNNASTVINLKLIGDNWAQLGNTVASMTVSDNGSKATAVFNNVNFIIPKNQFPKGIILVGDINSYPNAVSGSAHNFGILSSNDITAVGLTSAQVISASGAPVNGNSQTIYRSELTAVNAMGNIAGGRGAQQQIGKYRFSNASPGNYSITVSDIDLGINSIINNNATTSVKLYKDYPGGTKIAEKWFVGGADFSTINDWDSFTPFTIGAADGFGYADIFVVADTWDAAPMNAISTSIDTVTWSDGISQSNGMDGTPVIGAAVMY